MLLRSPRVNNSDRRCKTGRRRPVTPPTVYRVNSCEHRSAQGHNPARILSPRVMILFKRCQGLGGTFSLVVTSSDKTNRGGAVRPHPFLFRGARCAVSGRTYEPGGHRQPAEHPRPARTARPHCCRPSAAVPSSPEQELALEPGRPSEPGQEPEQQP